MQSKQIQSLINSYWKDNNYLIKNGFSNSNICCVFFSSLGIYKFNDIDELKNVYKSDRYEWKSISGNKNILSAFKKIIFIRDLKKVFYLDGINETIDSIEKLALFLMKETDGMDVYLVGSSAGGYVAYVISNYLDNVKRIYSLGGVVNLGHHSTYLDYLEEHKNTDVEPEICSINKNTFIIHFYGAFNQESIEGIETIHRCVSKENSLIIPLKSEQHAPRPTGEDLIKLLTCDIWHLRRVKKRIDGKKEIGYYRFSVCNLGFLKATFRRIKLFLRSGKRWERE